MGTKENLNELRIAQFVVPVAATPATALSTTSTAVDTSEYESTMFVLGIGATTGATNTVFQLQDTDTSSTTAGTAVTGKNVIFAVDNDSATWLGTTSAGLFVQSTGTLTATTDPVGRTFMFAYTGAKRWVRLVATAGSSITYSCTVIQGHPRYKGREGIHEVPYGSNISP